MAAAPGASRSGSESRVSAVQRGRAGEPSGRTDAGTYVGRRSAGATDFGGGLPPFSAGAARAVERSGARQIETLARNLPAVWQASQTSLAEKRQIVRRLLQRAVVWAPASTQEVTVQLHWAYGTVTEHRVTRPVHAWRHVIGATDLWQRVQEWQTAGWTSQCIAEELNRKGHRTPRGQPFTAESVRKLIERGGPRLVETRRATARPTKK